MNTVCMARRVHVNGRSECRAGTGKTEVRLDG